MRAHNTRWTTSGQESSMITTTACTSPRRRTAPRTSRVVTGYLTNVSNPQFSGLATVVIRSRKTGQRVAGPSSAGPQEVLFRCGKITRCVTDAGHGVRRLADAFDRFSVAGQHSKARFTISPEGLLESVEVL